MELNLTQRAIFDKFGKQFTIDLREALATVPLSKAATGGANASEKLSRSISYKITNTGITFYSQDYIWYLIYGRKPGKPAPYKAIWQWTIDKHIMPRDGITRATLVFMIQRKMAKQGTTIYREQKGKASKLINYIRNRELLDVLREDLGKSYAQRIKSEILSHANSNKPVPVE